MRAWFVRGLRLRLGLDFPEGCISAFVNPGRDVSGGGRCVQGCRECIEGGLGKNFVSSLWERDAVPASLEWPGLETGRLQR